MLCENGLRSNSSQAFYNDYYRMIRSYYRGCDVLLPNIFATLSGSFSIDKVLFIVVLVSSLQETKYCGMYNHGNFERVQQLYSAQREINNV